MRRTTPKALEQWTRALERGRIATDHDRQRALARADVAARDRRIQVVDTPRLQPRRDLPFGHRRDSAHIYYELFGLQRGFDLRDYRLDVGRVGHHDEHDVGARDACVGVGGNNRDVVDFASIEHERAGPIRVWDPLSVSSRHRHGAGAQHSGGPLGRNLPV